MLLLALLVYYIRRCCRPRQHDVEANQHPLADLNRTEVPFASWKHWTNQCVLVNNSQKKLRVLDHLKN
ncbi:hypothetical protein FOCC_FOCC007344 [Frankliniella occidentalis]|nr:hypothetical protein FOCC_FOCC007344 [Frankliniella occidentalis]